MKKLLLVLLFVPCALFGVTKESAEQAASNLNKFITMENKHEQDWLDSKKISFDAKMVMIKKHKSQWSELIGKYVEQMGKGVPAETLLVNKLGDMIKLHEAQNKEWANMCETNHIKKGDIAKKHETELNTFKKTLKKQ